MPSSAPNGSSSSIAGLPSRTVRRNAARWRMPPESCHGHARSNPARPKRSSSGRARSRAAAPPHAGQLEADRHVVDRPPPRQQRVALRHEGARAEPVARRLAVDQDLAVVGIVEAGEDSEQRALAGAARPDQRDELAGLRDEVDTVEREQRPLADPGVRLASGRGPRAARLAPRCSPCRVPYGRRSPPQHGALERGDDREQDQRQERRDDHRAEHEVGVAELVGDATCSTRAPAVAPTYSAKIAATYANVIDTFSPVKNCGSAPGSRTRQRI